MCKINGHSIFKYVTQPWNASKLYTSNARAKEVLKTQIEAISKGQTNAADIIAKNSKGDEISKTASVAKINSKPKKNQTLGSLRIPLETNSIGTSINPSTALGLNLGG